MTSSSNSTATWPVLPGAYQVGDPQAPVAVCALTSQPLVAPLARLAGVAIAGNVVTANHGIERIVVNVVTNPAIRFLLLCGKEAALFRPGQSLVALVERGLDGERQIIGAAGYEPVLPTVAPERVARFRRQVELVDWTGEEDPAAIEACIRGLVARSPGRFPEQEIPLEGDMSTSEPRFAPIRPGGQREPLQYDPKGYFVITLDRPAEQIVMRHYLSDHTPAHEMRGRSAGPMLLGLLREGLVTQLSHAGYLGEELAKAQVALQLDLRYDQDRPLRAPEAPAAGTPEDAGAGPASSQESAPVSDAKPSRTPQGMPGGTSPGMPSRMPPMQPTLMWSQLQSSAPGTVIDVALAISQSGQTPAAGQVPNRFVGAVLEPDDSDPFGVFRRTEHQLAVRWTSATRIVMGGGDDVRLGAVVRARGTLGADSALDAQQFAILTRVARIVE